MFWIRFSIFLKNVIILDDTIITGKKVTDCAEIMKENGAKMIISFTPHCILFK